MATKDAAVTQQPTKVGGAVGGAMGGATGLFKGGKGGNEFRYRIFDCVTELGTDNLGNCCYGYKLPGAAQASARTRFDGSHFLLNYCCGSAVGFRNIIREGYGIQGSFVTDCLKAICCHECNACQLLNEVDHRGPMTVDFPGRPEVAQEWTHSIFGCFKGCKPINFLFGCLAPCCAIAVARTKMDGSNLILNCCCFTPALKYNLIREGYNLKGAWYTDIVLPCCCLQCAACQTLNEVDARGKVNRVYRPLAVVAQPGSAMV